MKLEVRELAKTYAGRQGEVVALAPTSFSVAGGEFVSLLGPSGCGKSTTLGIIAGLEEATAGAVFLDGARVTAPGPERGMVFQSYTLFPWLTVEENTRFALGLAANARRAGTGAADDLHRADALLEVMGLADFRRAYPRELSGGMKQRVAIARALVNRPKVLLMDEPFGALDAQTREEMQELMLLLQRHERTTVLFVTHDIEESMYLSNRVLVFSRRPGRIVRDVTVPFGPGAERTLDLKLAPEFALLKRELFQLLHRSPRSTHALDALATKQGEQESC
ncbi:MAG TPA: ABC transporter ATP-binding protein [Polyangia bacterium]|nr:ABC transporter ATP-binding protein [Polyangia bacterium]